MEKCDESLYSYLKSSRFNQRQLLNICLQAAKAVCLAHQQCIYHADLSLGNFFIASGIIKLGDFGACRTGETRSILTEHRVGTGVFVAPEVYDGSVNPTTAADVYSLGVCFLAIFNRGATPKVTFRELLSGTRIPCNSIPFDRLRSFVECMVDHDPDQRPSSSEVVAILESEIRRRS